MANYFQLRKGLSDQDHVRIRKELNSRVDGCFTVGCWTLKDKDDRGELYLSKKVIDGGSGKYVQIRRYLFLTTWKTIPDRRKLIAHCETPRCLNPTHVYYRGFKPPYDTVTNLIASNWITEEQVNDWYK